MSNKIKGQLPIPLERLKTSQFPRQVYYEEAD